jgi:hypothetical protein
MAQGRSQVHRLAAGGVVVIEDSLGSRETVAYQEAFIMRMASRTICEL